MASWHKRFEVAKIVLYFDIKLQRFFLEQSILRFELPLYCPVIVLVQGVRPNFWDPLLFGFYFTHSAEAASLLDRGCLLDAPPLIAGIKCKSYNLKPDIPGLITAGLYCKFCFLLIEQQS